MIPVTSRSESGDHQGHVDHDRAIKHREHITSPAWDRSSRPPARKLSEQCKHYFIYSVSIELQTIELTTIADVLPMVAPALVDGPDGDRRTPSHSGQDGVRIGILRTARAILRNEAEAHDAAQQALVSAWVHLPKLRDPDRFDVWLNRTLVNACRETLRRRGRSREIDLDGWSVRSCRSRRWQPRDHVNPGGIRTPVG